MGVELIAAHLDRLRDTQTVSVDHEQQRVVADAVAAFLAGIEQLTDLRCCQKLLTALVDVGRRVKSARRILYEVGPLLDIGRQDLCGREPFCPDAHPMTKRVKYTSMQGYHVKPSQDLDTLDDIEFVQLAQRKDGNSFPSIMQCNNRRL